QPFCNFLGRWAGISVPSLFTSPVTDLFGTGIRVFIKDVLRAKANVLHETSRTRNIPGPQLPQRGQKGYTLAEITVPNGADYAVPVTALVTAVISDSVCDQRTNDAGHHRNQNPTNSLFHGC